MGIQHWDTNSPNGNPTKLSLIAILLPPFFIKRHFFMAIFLWQNYKILFKQDSKVVSAPIAALVQHTNMNLDYVKLNLNINVINESEEEIQVLNLHINLHAVT